ncbi:MAG: MFS transporter [Chloroflexota bacterium]
MEQDSTIPVPWTWSRLQSAQIGVLTFARFCLNTSLRIVYPFAPAFSRGLGVPVTLIYSFISLRNLLSLLSPVLAPLPERYGRRVTMTAGVVLFGLVALLAAFLPLVWTLALVIIVTGLVKVVFDPAMQSYLGDTVPYKQRGRALAVTEFAWSGAYLIGAPVTGWLIAGWGWSTPYLWLGIGGLIAAVLLWRYVPTARNHDSHTITLSYTWQMVRRYPVIWAAALYMALTLIAQESLFIVYGDWMEGSFNLSLTSLGMATMLIGVAEMTGEATAGWSVDRFGKRPVVMLAGLLNAGIYLLIPWVSGDLTMALITLFFLFSTFEIAVVGAIPLLTELIPGARTAVMAMSLGAMAAGRTIGSIVGPFLWERMGITGNAVLAAIVMMLAVLVLARWLHEGQPEEA